MASIKFLNNITLVGNQLELARIQNLGSAPTVYGDGQLYYDTATNKLTLRENGNWVPIQTGTEVSYDLTVPSGTTAIRLTDGTTNDDITITGGTNVTVVRTSATELTINATDSAAGTVTSVGGGTGITISGTPTVTPTVNIDYLGSDNAILATPSTGTPVGADTIWFSDADDSNIKKATISAFPGFGKDGTVTSVGTGNSTFISGSGGPITGAGNLTYSLSATGTPSATTFLRGDNAWATPAGAYTDWKLIGDGGTPVDIGDGESVNFIGGAGIDATAASGTPNTLTLALDLNELQAVSAASSDYIAIVDSTDNSTKKALVSSLPFTNNSGVTSIDLAGDTGSTSAITSTGTFTIAGGTNVTTSASGTTVTINSTDQFQGTVTSVTAGLGLTQTGTSTVNPTILVDYSNAGIINDATGMSGSAEADDIILLADDSLSGAVRSASLVDIPLNVLGLPNADLNINSQKLTSVANGTAGTDGVNLGQVQGLIAGVGLFKGGYNANTGLTTDLGAGNGSLDGASNIALDLGDFFAVTVAGTAFFTESLEPGDMIYANTDIAANSSPSISDYTVVIQDANVAGVGATDGGTDKGVAGFSSASFAGTSNGFITIKAGGISDAQLASTFNKIIGTDSDINTSGVDVIDQLNMTDGVIQSHSTRTLPDSTESARGVTEIATQAEVDAGTDDFRYVTPEKLANYASIKTFVGTYPATNTNSWTVAHGLGTADVIVQIYELSSGATVYADVQRDTSSPYSLTINTGSTTTASTLRVMVTRVG